VAAGDSDKRFCVDRVMLASCCIAQDQEVTIHDAVRGEVTWNTNTLGDFVILRSNGQPVYNFCVAVDDATMKISHVLRAEEHLPNTLRQVSAPACHIKGSKCHCQLTLCRMTGTRMFWLQDAPHTSGILSMQMLLYKALGFEPPVFGHMSLILAPDKSKLSKRCAAETLCTLQCDMLLQQGTWLTALHVCNQAWCHIGGRVQRRGILAGCHGELPGAAGLERGRWLRTRDLFVGRAAGWLACIEHNESY
jgi:tRNA synthetases class I (E and Q), catalytic domain